MPFIKICSGRPFRQGGWRAAILVPALVLPARAGAVPDPADPAVELPQVEVASTLGRVREEIVPSLGATTYTVGGGQLEAIAQGENAPFSQILLRAPGVVQDSFGEDHVRGEHGGIQYRVNGILLPEGLNGFGQELDPHFIDSVALTTGTLPAQFGFRTSGVVDVVTKSGERLDGGEAGIYGGGPGVVQPSLQYGSSAGSLDYFFSASGKETGLGIENPTASRRPLHDDSGQIRSFGYLSWQLDQASRLSMLLSVSLAEFQIPDTPGLAPRFELAGAGPPDSATLDERQEERNGYLVLAYQRSVGGLDCLIAGFSRYGRIHFRPDQAGDLVFNGVASDVCESSRSNGVQFDAVHPWAGDHKLRGGFLVVEDLAARDTTTDVFAADQAGRQLSDVPFGIADRSRLRGLLTGIYVQDEWHPVPSLTVNYGLRGEFFDAFIKESQLDPRLNLVWAAGHGTSFHAGYARYFTPPTLQYLSPARLAPFAGTTNAPETFADAPPRSERAHYFDAGASCEPARGWQVAIDAFCKLSRNTQDLGQFGNAIILAPFNYEEGSARGFEVSGNYHAGGFSTYSNFSFVYTQARNIDTAQFEFPTAELDYIRTHSIRLDHEGEFTVSSGISYAWAGTLISGDILYGSGLRDGFANEGHLPGYHPVNLGLERSFHPGGRRISAVKLRLDVTNIFDETYRLRDGSGVGIAASQYGARRGFYAGTSLLF